MNVPLANFSRDAIGALLPDCVDSAEREVRRRLGICRDLASAKIPHLPPGHALTLNGLIVETAAASVFAPASIEQLDDALRYCRRLLLCARWAEAREVQYDDED